jgi:1,2-dihydroxy-3-keto-5-methylthiopentene dioxygenase
MTEAWIMCENVSNQRGENRCSPNVPVSAEDLAELGVFHRKLDPQTMLDGGPCEVDRMMEAMGYKARDECVISPGTMPDYDDKLKIFFTEHIHEDEEVRLIKAGQGFFDVRNGRDNWVRIFVTPGDFVVIPAGLYHRFTVDESNFTHAIRLFSENPKWVSINRPCEENSTRRAYLQMLANPTSKSTVLGHVEEDNVHVVSPFSFDAVVKAQVSRLDPVKKDLIVFYFTGAKDPKTSVSWCPDCVAADPIVCALIHAAREKRRVVFVECSVERTGYVRNPANFYRTHPFVELQSIPTLIVAQARDDSDEQGIDVVIKQEHIDGSWLALL